LEVYKKGSLADGASLAIEVVPFEFRCRSCGGKSFRDELPYICTACNSADVELLGGMDITLEKIEVETGAP